MQTAHIALSKLQGRVLAEVSRAASMLMFSFGERRSIPDVRRGGLRDTCEFTLHIQCPWRLCLLDRILVGSQDVFYHADTPWDKPNPEGFDWDVSGANRCDRFFDNFIVSHAAAPLMVDSISVDDFGGFRIGLSGGFSLDCFPDVGTSDELWRLLQPGTSERHFVMDRSS